jgi:hypothetical protein
MMDIASLLEGDNSNGSSLYPAQQPPSASFPASAAVTAPPNNPTPAPFAVAAGPSPLGVVGRAEILQVSPPNDDGRAWARRLSTTSAAPFASQPDTDTLCSLSQHHHHQQQQQQQQQQNHKRTSERYTFKEQVFLIYHRTDLGLSWEEVKKEYMAHWPGTTRTATELRKAYSRTNRHIPVTTANGELELVDPKVAEHQEYYGNEKQGYLEYKGVLCRTKMALCRDAVSLMERFPEELVDTENVWVREFHRDLARGAGES